MEAFCARLILETYHLRQAHHASVFFPASTRRSNASPLDPSRLGSTSSIVRGGVSRLESKALIVVLDAAMPSGVGVYAR